MPVQKLREFLDKNRVKYLTIGHSQSFSAQEIAASAHISGKNLAKVVMVKLDGKMAMAVLQGHREVDLNLLKKVAGAKKTDLADEQEFKDSFPSCEVGSMPPFGNLYDMPVYVDKFLTADEEIAFNAGSHRELVKMAYKDFERLVKPKVGEFSKLGT